MKWVVFMRKMGFLGLIYFKNGVKSEFWAYFTIKMGVLGQFCYKNGIFKRKMGVFGVIWLNLL
jgi:hypothetical protein